MSNQGQINCCGVSMKLTYLFCVAITITGLVLLAGCGDSIPSDGFLHAGGHLYSGVKVYNGVGETKNLAFEVLGGNDNYTDPYSGRKFRGLKVRMPNGAEEWKDRDAIIRGDIYWVKADDPAISEGRWEVFTS
jgi:hypothetical protein